MLLWIDGYSSNGTRGRCWLLALLIITCVLLHTPRRFKVGYHPHNEIPKILVFEEPKVKKCSCACAMLLYKYLTILKCRMNGNANGTTC